MSCGQLFNDFIMEFMRPNRILDPTFTSPMTLILDFQGQILNLLYLRNEMVNLLGMGLIKGHGVWQIDQPTNGSMWNSYNFQHVVPWNRLFVHWSRGWGVLLLSKSLVSFLKGHFIDCVKHTTPTPHPNPPAPTPTPTLALDDVTESKIM